MYLVFVRAIETYVYKQRDMRPGTRNEWMRLCAKTKMKKRAIR